MSRGACKIDTLRLTGQTPFRDGNTADADRVIVLLSAGKRELSARFGVTKLDDNDTLWSIIQSDVPALLSLLRNIKSP